MFPENMAHYGNWGERKFDNDKCPDARHKKEIHIYSYQEGYQKGYEKGNEAGFQEGFQKGIEQERAKREAERLKRNKKKKKQEAQAKKKRIVVIICRVFMLFFFIVVSAVCACLCAFFEGLGRWMVGASGLLFVASIFEPIKELIIKELITKDKSDGDKHKDFLLTAFNGLRRAWRHIRYNSLIALLLGLSLSFFVGAFYEGLNIHKCVTEGKEAFQEAFVKYNSKILKKSSDNEAEELLEDNNQVIRTDEAEWENQEVRPESDCVTDENAAVDSEITVCAREDFFEESDTSEDELSQVEIADVETEQIINLSAEHSAAVFFTGGDYQIFDWENQQEINDKVLAMVSGARSEEKLSIFDQMAPRDMRNDISEMAKQDKSTNSFSEKQSINTKRIAAYEEYPKRSLAGLISNSEQWQALALFYYDGQQETIMYHYAQSVLWDIEYLKYKGNTESDIQDRLLIIAKRYEDIAFTCTKCSERGYAQKLQAAFENAAGHYWGTADDKSR